MPSSRIDLTKLPTNETPTFGVELSCFCSIIAFVDTVVVVVVTVVDTSKQLFDASFC